jgi:hypothetical protein
MHFDLTIPLAELSLLLRGEVLISEKDDTSFGNKQGQLVLLLGSKVLELQAFDLGADVSSQVSDLRCSSKQIFLGLVSSGSCVLERYFLVPDLIRILELQWPSRTVRVSLGQVDPGFLKALSRRAGQA